MKLNINTPLQALNKAFRKEKISRDLFNKFKDELRILINRINEDESEEHLKYPLRDFLKNTFYLEHEINTKGKTDMGVYLDKTDKSKLGVIIETKKPSNAGDMITTADINKKAMHEAILYYLRERIDENNNEVKTVIITNIYEWFIFNAHDFERLFYKSNLAKEYNKWKTGQKTSLNTPLFYTEIARPFLDECDKEISATWFNLRDYHQSLVSDDKQAEKKLTALYKIFSGVTLLKESFTNDSNSLDKRFYNELLHIIGLEEKKEGSKKTIKRKASPDHGSLIENTIATLDANEKLHKVENRDRYGVTKEEQLFHVALELVITWVNRILFLKLLEAQLVRYHQGNKEYKFLDSKFIADFDELNELFFEVLAKHENERKEYIKEKFRFIPYLNSSLFEMKPGSLEDNTILISNLKGRFNLHVSSQTVLRRNGKRLSGELPTLKYLFDFLDAYDFASEGAEEIQEENKTLINASVLGLIFEKINGYKDGSFFTPGFITMYMCRETIRRAVLQKFEEIKGWKCENLDQLKDRIENRSEANSIVNNLKICDPAVGSGHFLVSALNEIIVIKSELDILSYRNGNRIRNYRVEMANDELIITDKETEDIFEYRLNDKERPVDYLQEMQEALFHEKQTIIENCLFGVDINPNSVNICRLRLWIELLKNAYYTKESGYATLETLPNIDINIKCGNSLVSRFPLDADLSKALKTIKYNIHTYRKCVVDYKKATNKGDKRSLEILINQIKSDFRDEIQNNDPKYIRLNKVKGEMSSLITQTRMFELSPEQKKEFDKKVERYSTEQTKLEKEITEIKNNIIYRNAFEWRFEFPEVLDDEGNFMGYDVVIGNPPYITGKSFPLFHGYFTRNFLVCEYQLDLYTFFIELSVRLLKVGSVLSLITPNSWLKNIKMSKTRKFILEKLGIVCINPNINKAFEEAQVDTMIFIACKGESPYSIKIFLFNEDNVVNQRHTIHQSEFVKNKNYIFDVEVNPTFRSIIHKIRNQSIILDDAFEITRGVNPYDKYRGQSQEIILSRAYHADYKKDDTFQPELRGKHVSTFGYNWDEKHYISYGNWLAAPRDPKFFKGDRIVFREIISDRFICTLISEDFIIDRSLYIAKPKRDKLALYCILGVLASKLMVWLFKYEKNEFDELFPKIRLEEFRNLPIPKEFFTRERLDDLVIKILDHKKQNLDSNISNLETELDELIYQLYSLTEEEIKIIETSIR